MNFIDLTSDSEDENVGTSSKELKTIDSDDSEIEIINISSIKPSHGKSKSSTRLALKPASLHIGTGSDSEVEIEVVQMTPSKPRGRNHNVSHIRTPGPNSSGSSSSSTTKSPTLRDSTNHPGQPVSLPSTHVKSKPGPSRPKAHSDRSLKSDERLARKLQAQDQKEYQKLIKGITTKKEGIVFRTAINADGTLEDGSPAHPDDLARFEPWKKLFETTSGTQVKRFHWIVNYELEKRFQETKTLLSDSADAADDPTKELLLFHGTGTANIDSILNGGFRIGGVGSHRVVNGTMLGFGVYLAASAATSIGYAAGANRIFACRVFPGKITGDLTYAKTPPKTKDPLDEPYQTYSATFGPGIVYVVRYACLVLPCYVSW
ncbi:ADP-ribosylation [Lentinula aff. detonsa]|uniref:ADP-ribosylation n=1 Tax=Lentinula aff. detonsa TaxID=2804958 RepID=A0AA38K9L4_9AGAR|nr:ADP-ribosylation [Lentinula aff. detonsa]